MSVSCILLSAYLLLSSTVGAWWLANNHIDRKRDITLLDIVGNIIPAIFISWVAIFILLESITVKKHKKKKIK